MSSISIGKGGQSGAAISGPSGSSCQNVTLRVTHLSFSHNFNGQGNCASSNGHGVCSGK